MMARYIDADKLKESFSTDTQHLSTFDPDLYDLIVLDIDEAPTADVMEVKHGAWELKSEIHKMLDDVDEEFYVECPFCHRVNWIPFEFEEEKMLRYAKEKYPYCNCGAKMDGGLSK